MNTEPHPFPVSAPRDIYAGTSAAAPMSDEEREHVAKTSTGASRRGFMLAALTAFAAALTPARAATRRRRHFLLNRFPIAGFRHHAGPRCLAHLEPGAPLLLQAEPAHPMDPYAVRICWRGHLLGYIPRTDNKHLSRLLRQGAALEARITAVHPAASPWEQVRMEVSLIA